MGNRAMMAAVGVHVDEDNGPADGATVAWVAVAGALVGRVSLADRPRPQSKDDVARLRQGGLEVVMLTGDSRPAAEAVARQVGIETVRADVLPADKAAAVEALQAEGRCVAMVGDGINDAPALATADVGMAFATGTDVAAASAPVVLMHSRLADVARAIELSRAVVRTIKQNLFWAFFLQCRRHSDSCGRTLPIWRPAAQSNAGEPRDGLFVGVGGDERAPVAAFWLKPPYYRLMLCTGHFGYGMLRYAQHDRKGKHLTTPA